MEWHKVLQKFKELVFTSNFSFSHNVFKIFVLQARKNQGLFGKGFRNMHEVTFRNHCEKRSIYCLYKTTSSSSPIYDMVIKKYFFSCVITSSSYLLSPNSKVASLNKPDMGNIVGKEKIPLTSILSSHKMFLSFLKKKKKKNHLMSSFILCLHFL